MFDDFFSNCKLCDEAKPSKRRVGKNIAAVRSLIETTETEGNTMTTKRKIRIKPLIIAAAASFTLLAGFTTAVMWNRANVAAADAAVGVEEVEVKSGNYYLNGDVDSGLWIEVTPETISLKGDDIDTSMREAIVNSYEEELSEDFIQEYMDRDKLLYCEEKPYYAYLVDLSTSHCIIKVDRNNRPVEDREDLKDTNAGFPYEKSTDTIHLSLFGGFTLVE